MSAKTDVLYPTGIALDGKVMMGGVARLWFQEGFPVDMAFEECRKNNWRVDWLEALCDAWLNDPAKYDAILHDMDMLEGEGAGKECDDRFKTAGAIFMADNPGLGGQTVDEFCRWMIQRKKAWVERQKAA